MHGEYHCFVTQPFLLMCSSIINDFYRHTTSNRKPRTFGMTASPIDVDVHHDAETRAQDLEHLLDAKIATASSLALLQHNTARPEEIVATYPQTEVVFDTALWRSLRAQYWDLPDFGRLFDNAKAINVELGRWCSDRYWSFAFSDVEAKKAEARLQYGSRAGRAAKQHVDFEEEISHLHQANEAIQSHNFGLPAAEIGCVSNKVLKLYTLISHYFKERTKARCLVFVDRRSTARLLLEIFKHLGSYHLRPGALVGSASLTYDGMRNSFREQILTLSRFRTGELNCLFATSVAEEGIDIRECNIIIRFDLCKTMIQLIQSRGRARHRESVFIHLVEEGNMLHADRLERIKDAEKRMRKFCETLPEDRLLDKRVDNDAAGKVEVFKIPEPQGATLTWDFSLAVLAHFVGALPFEPEDDRYVNYFTYKESGKFVCEVILPKKSPLQSFKGEPQGKKTAAKRAAAFAACVWLYKHKYLDKNLLPQYSKQLPKMRNALLALNSQALVAYSMHMKPRAWEIGRGILPKQLFLTIIRIAGNWDLPVSSLGLLTRSRMPHLPDFPIFSTSGWQSSVESTSFLSGIDISFQDVDLLSNYTFTVFEDVFVKEFRHDNDELSYWFAPLHETGIQEVMSASTKILTSNKLRMMLDWEEMDTVKSWNSRKWSAGMPVSFLVDRFIVDPGRGGRRFFIKAVSTFKPTDNIPLGVAAHRLVSSAKTILDYSVNRPWAEREVHLKVHDQPVFQAGLCDFRLNFLTGSHEREKDQATLCYICPEPLEISPLAPKAAAMARVFPAVLHRLESYRLASELADELGLEIPPGLALEAITKDSETSGDQIRKQRGMGPNYERLEFIGDCFLKLATTMAVYAKKIGSDEFAMHCDRMVMLCNKNLFNNCKKSGWYKYIRSRSFDRYGSTSVTL